MRNRVILYSSHAPRDISLVTLEVVNNRTLTLYTLVNVMVSRVVTKGNIGHEGRL